MFVDGNTVSKVEFTEKQRNSQLATDIGTLLNRLVGAAAKQAHGLAANTCGGAIPLEADTNLQYTRSTLTLTAKDKGGNTVATTTVVTGPDEHWDLSVDLPVTNRKSLKYDSASGSLQPTESNPQLYIGFDYQLGDILTPPKGWLTKDRIVIKGLFLASSRPLNSFGVALGYTLPSIKFWQGKGLGPISIFVGRFWTKHDALKNGVVRTDYSYAKSWRIGISYSLSSMADKLHF